MEDNIRYIQSLIQNGKAYEVDGYVVLDSAKVNIICEPKPVQYPILLKLVRNETDYPLWAPNNTEFSHISPWGNGLVTVNLHYIREYLRSINEKTEK